MPHYAAWVGRGGEHSAQVMPVLIDVSTWSLWLGATCDKLSVLQKSQVRSRAAMYFGFNSLRHCLFSPACRPGCSLVEMLIANTWDFSRVL